MPSRVKFKVIGRVQGVFYRQSTVDQARVLGLCGWVANEPDGSVIVDAQGEREKLECLLVWCRKGPPSAQVSSVEVKWLDEIDPEFTRFEVRR